MVLEKSQKMNGIEISLIRKMNALAKKDTINLGIGQLPYNLPKDLEEKGKDAFDKRKTRYTPNQGTIELRELVAFEASSTLEKTITSNNVIITNGAEGALWNTFYSFLNKGDKVLIPEISFPVYETIPKMNGANSQTFKLNKDFGIDFEDLESKINDKTKFIVINSPNNPTGKIYSEEEIKTLVNIAEKNNTYIISDEIYGELYFDNQKPTSPTKFSDKVITINGISKSSCATGLRIGWAIASEDIIKTLTIANQYSTTCPSSISQYAAEAAFSNNSLNFQEKVRLKLEENRNITYEELASHPIFDVVRPEGAFYCFPNISKFGSSEEVAKRILSEANVLTIPGKAFGEAGDDYIRVSYAVGTKDLIEGVKRIKDTLREWTPRI